METHWGGITWSALTILARGAAAINQKQSFKRLQQQRLWLIFMTPLSSFGSCLFLSLRSHCKGASCWLILSTATFLCQILWKMTFYAGVPPPKCWWSDIARNKHWLSPSANIRSSLRRRRMRNRGTRKIDSHHLSHMHDIRLTASIIIHKGLNLLLVEIAKLNLNYSHLFLLESDTVCALCLLKSYW